MEVHDPTLSSHAGRSPGGASQAAPAPSASSNGPLWLAVVAMLFPTAITWIYFRVLAGHSAAPIVYGVGKTLQFALPIIGLLLAGKAMSWRWGPGWSAAIRPSWRRLGPGLVSGLVIGLAALLLYSVILKGGAWMAEAPALVARKLVELSLIPAEFAATPWRASPARYLALALFLAVPHALLEEYYYRWFIHGALRRRLSLGWATLLSSAAFMGHHVIVLHAYFPDQPAATAFFSLCIFVGGAIWALMYERSHSLWSPWISHVLVDLVIMGVGYDLVWGG